MSTEISLPPGHEQTVAGFNLYRTNAVKDVLDDIRIATSYAGVVVEGPARVVKAQDHEVVLEVKTEQARALSKSLVAFIDSPVHGTSFRASVKKLWWRRNEVVLSHFEPFKDCISRRRNLRAAPTHAMLVRMICGERNAFARVLDISTEAVAVMVDQRALDRLDCSQEPLDLDIWGEPAGTQRLADFKVKGKILRVETGDEFEAPFCKAVLSLQAYPTLEQALGRYIGRLQQQILLALECETQTSRAA